MIASLPQVPSGKGALALTVCRECGGKISAVVLRAAPFPTDGVCPVAQQVVRGDLGPSLSRVPELPVCFQIHDFAITRHYAIIMDLPLMFDPQVMVCLRFLIATPLFA